MVSPNKTPKKISPSFKGVIKAGQKQSRKKKESSTKTGEMTFRNYMTHWNKSFMVQVKTEYDLTISIVLNFSRI